MKVVIALGVITGLAIVVIALVVFNDNGDSSSVTSNSGSFSAPIEIAPSNPDPSNPGSDFSLPAGALAGITGGGPDPQFLLQQLEAAGVEIP